MSSWESSIGASAKAGEVDSKTKERLAAHTFYSKDFLMSAGIIILEVSLEAETHSFEYKIRLQNRSIHNFKVECRY
jgi:hypothetical protein